MWKPALVTPLTEQKLSSGVIGVLDTVSEKSLQPIVFRDENVRKTDPIATGEIQLGRSVYADWLDINMDPADHRSQAYLSSSAYTRR
ncbi:hypothetical protein EYZ11_005842 [Aspergillus tanneri]|uniref:Uncharacterized protein n=1 Tax=Aspergillus tanneri TaxID=1220188 RepID=A0A4S3JJC6_9EURO|nr:hypothetical protein EYZ11_005842 [Aspergillus tanneri]